MSDKEIKFTPKISDIETINGEFTFILSGDDEYGLDVSLANSIRRILLTEIPTIGFNIENNDITNDLKIINNNSSIHNEMLLHRISLIPLYINPERYLKNYLFECKIKHNNDELYTFVTSNNINIYPLKDHLQERVDRFYDDKDMTDEDKQLLLNQLNDIKYDNYDMDNPLSQKDKDKIYKPTTFRNNKYYCLLNELKTTNTEFINQELHFYGSPSIGYGYENSCYQSVSQSTYSYVKNKDLIADTLKNKIINNNLQTPEEISEFEEKFMLSESERYYYRDNYNESNKYRFSIKSNHYYSENKLFLVAIELLMNKLYNFKNNIIDYLKNDNDEILNLTKKKDNIYILNIINENHTLGNLVHKFMNRYHINEESLISTFSYKKPHPLEERIIFIISININHKKYKELDEINKNQLILSNLIESIDLLINDINILYKVSEKKL